MATLQTLTAPSRNIIVCGAALVACLVLSVSCAESGRKREVYRGHYRDAFESSTFTPCNSANTWWVKGAAPPFDERANRSATSIQPRVLYVEWTGTLRGPGRFGHLGKYAYEIEVENTIIERAPSPGDCG